MARKKIEAEDIVHNEVVVAPDFKAVVNDRLEEAKGKFTAVAIIGVDENGVFDLITNVEQYSYLQWMLNKGSFELFIHEKSANQKAA